MKNKYLIPLIIYISVVGDALRDEWMSEIYKVGYIWDFAKWMEWSQAQWMFHLAKWGSMFSLWGLLTYLWFKDVRFDLRTFTIWLLFMIACNITWNWIY